MTKPLNVGTIGYGFMGRAHSNAYSNVNHFFDLAYRAKFLQDWTFSPELPQGGAALWRLDVAAAGSGVSGDLLVHCIDTALWLNGDLDQVNAMTETFIKERKHNLTGKVEKVGIDDA